MTDDIHEFTTDSNPETVAQTGCGKAQHLAEIYRCVADTDSTEFIDPKGGDE